MRSGPRLHVVLASVIAIGLLSGGVGIPNVRADTVDQQRQRVESITDDLEALERRIGELDEQYGAALDRIDQLTAEIQVSQAEVDAQNARLGVLRTQLSAIALDTYMSGGAVGATPLLGSAVAVTEELQRGQLSRVALDQGAGSTDEMEALAADLDVEKQALESRRAEQAALLASLESQQTEGDALVADYEQRLAAAEVELGNMVVEEQQRRAEAELAQAQARVAKAREAQLRETEARAAQSQQGTGDSGSGGTSRGGGATPTSTPSNDGSNDNSADDNSADDNDDNDGARSGSTSPVAPEPPPTPTVPAPSSMSGIAVNAASSQLGVAYKFAAESPGQAFDCSGLTKFAWGKAGVYLPHQSSAQYASTPHVPKDQAQPGDLIFYYSPIGHVGIYIGGGSLIHAPSPGDVVKVSPVNWNKVVGVSRPG